MVDNGHLSDSEEAIMTRLPLWLNCLTVASAVKTCDECTAGQGDPSGWFWNDIGVASHDDKQAAGICRITYNRVVYLKLERVGASNKPTVERE